MRLIAKVFARIMMFVWIYIQQKLHRTWIEYILYTPQIRANMNWIYNVYTTSSSEYEFHRTIHVGYRQKLNSLSVWIELSFTLYELNQIECKWMIVKTSSPMLLVSNSTIGLIAISNGTVKVFVVEAQRIINGGRTTFNETV